MSKKHTTMMKTKKHIYHPSAGELDLHFPVISMTSVTANESIN